MLAFAAPVWGRFAAFSRAPAPPAPWLRLCSSAEGALEGVNSCLKIPKSLSTMRASDKPEPSSFLKGKQNVLFFFLLRGTWCKVQAEQGSVALGEGSQKHILLKFNRMVTVSLSKLQLNINSVSSRD